MTDQNRNEPNSPETLRPSLSREERDSEETSDVEHSPDPNNEPPEKDVPPDGGYGWVCVACNFFINCESHWNNERIAF